MGVDFCADDRVSLEIGKQRHYRSKTKEKNIKNKGHATQSLTNNHLGDTGLVSRVKTNISEKSSGDLTPTKVRLVDCIGHQDTTTFEVIVLPPYTQWSHLCMFKHL